MTSGESGKDLPALRASHQDRDRVIEALRVAAGDGRLTLDELDQRIELAMAALTYAELAPLTADLPAAGTPLSSPQAPSEQAKDVVRIERGNGHTQRDGRWVVPKRMEIKIGNGHVLLDFTEAVITEPLLRIDAEIHNGHFSIVTRPGIEVDIDDVFVGNGHANVRRPWAPEVPVTLRIEVAGKVGNGHLSAGPRRRTFWQWLTRKPLPYAVSARQLPAA
jgi:Domain of unknown function (DUF1707)